MQQRGSFKIMTKYTDAVTSKEVQGLQPTGLNQQLWQHFFLKTQNRASPNWYLLQGHDIV